MDHLEGAGLSIGLHIDDAEVAGECEVETVPDSFRNDLARDVHGALKGPSHVDRAVGRRREAPVQVRALDGHRADLLAVGRKHRDDAVERARLRGSEEPTELQSVSCRLVGDDGCARSRALLSIRDSTDWRIPRLLRVMAYATRSGSLCPDRLEPSIVTPVLVDEARPTRRGALDCLAREWQSAPRRWGHPLHGICSYFAMFPPQVPRVFIEWLTQPGDVVFDPFSGRGTAPMEAARLGRAGLGSDANPLAYVLTAAKIDPPDASVLALRLEALRKSVPRRRGPVPDDIRMLYAPRVLRQLWWLRENLNVETRVDRFILATVMGLMHANYEPGSPARGFSISMPNTFSMSPRYVRNFIAEHKLEPPRVDVFDMISRKIGRLSLPSSRLQRGRAWVADARSPGPIPEGPAQLVFTSPPYLGVIKYGKYNWIRLWMLSKEPRAVDAVLTATSSLRRYLEFMSQFLTELQATVAEAGFICLMIGDVRNKSTKEVLNLAETVWRNVARPTGWRRLGIVQDHVPIEHKVSRIWGHKHRGNATKVDRILILAPPGSSHVLPALPSRPFDWSSAPAWA